MGGSRACDDRGCNATADANVYVDAAHTAAAGWQTGMEMMALMAGVELQFTGGSGSGSGDGGKCKCRCTQHAHVRTGMHAVRRMNEATYLGPFSTMQRTVPAEPMRSMLVMRKSSV